MITIREATIHDNAALLALTKRTPMRGVISLRIDRDPDFFRLLQMRGPGKVFVAVVDHRIVGCISVVYQSVFIEGTPQKVGYIDDLKVDPLLQGSRAALKLVKALHNYVMTQDVDLYFCLVAHGNDKTLPFLRGRFGLPAFKHIGRFIVYEILPSSIPRTDMVYDIGIVREDARQEVRQLCNAFNRSYQFAPVLPENAYTISAGEVPIRALTARKDGAVRATLCACDMHAVKQNVVVGMPIWLRTVVGALRVVSPPLPLGTLPCFGEAVRILYLRHVAYEDGHQRALRGLLQRMRKAAAQEQYAFIVLGMHERAPGQSLVRGLPKFTFVSHGFVMSLSQNRALLDKVVSGIPMVDFALV